MNILLFSLEDERLNMRLLSDRGYLVTQVRSIAELSEEEPADLIILDDMYDAPFTRTWVAIGQELTTMFPRTRIMLKSTTEWDEETAKRLKIGFHFIGGGPQALLNNVRDMLAQPIPA